MGATSEAKIAKAIDRLGLTGKDRRTPIADALPLADRLVTELGLVGGVTDVAFCGSLRRMSETIGDIDITVASTEPAAVMAAVLASPAVSDVVVSGDTKTSFLTPTGFRSTCGWSIPTSSVRPPSTSPAPKPTTSRSASGRSIAVGCSTNTA